MNRYAKAVFLGVLSVAWMLLSGCETMTSRDQTSDPAPEWTYMLGELKSSQVIPFDRAWGSVHIAIADMHYDITASEKDPLEGKLTVVGQGKEVHIALEETSISTTEIRIRVGTFGDK